MAKKYTPKNCLWKDEHDTMRPDMDGLCFCCGLKIGKTWDEKLQDEIDSIPKEEKQKFITFFVEGKGNLGEAVDMIDPEGKYERAAWYTILSNQIETVGYEKVNPVVE